MTLRGLVIPMTLDQTLQRARRMANHKGMPWFDSSLPVAPGGYYRLSFPNGGTDPTAPDNFTHWHDEHDEKVPPFEYITGDCVSMPAWAGGWDRKQPVRGAHIQGGSINCDFMRADAGGPAKCFHRIPQPIPGCIVVYGSLPDQDHDGDRDGAGHTALVKTIPPELVGTFDPKNPAHWKAITLIDCAARTPQVAVQERTGSAFFGSRKGHGGVLVPKDSWFLVSVMKP